jgi:hypothetical protein
VSSFDFVSEALLQKVVDDGKMGEIPAAPKLRCEELEKYYDEDEKILLAVKEYLLQRAILRAKYEKINEYRRHVGMVVKIEGEEITVNIDKVTEYYTRAKELIEYIQETYDD